MLSPPAVESSLITTDVSLSQLAGRSAPSWTAGKVSHNQSVEETEEGRDTGWGDPWTHGGAGQERNAPQVWPLHLCPGFCLLTALLLTWACIPLPGSLRSQGRMTAAGSRRGWWQEWRWPLTARRREGPRALLSHFGSLIHSSCYNIF